MGQAGIPSSFQENPGDFKIARNCPASLEELAQYLRTKQDSGKMKVRWKKKKYGKGVNRKPYGKKLQLFQILDILFRRQLQAHLL